MSSSIFSHHLRGFPLLLGHEGVIDVYIDVLIIICPNHSNRNTFICFIMSTWFKCFIYFCVCFPSFITFICYIRVAIIFILNHLKAFPFPFCILVFSIAYLITCFYQSSDLFLSAKLLASCFLIYVCYFRIHDFSLYCFLSFLLSCSSSSCSQICSDSFKFVASFN